MDYRANVYSPLQNIAVWLGAWGAGIVPSDDVLKALNELGGPHRLAGSSPEHCPTLALLKLVRKLADSHNPDNGEPWLHLVLGGPGEAPAVPAGTPPATAITAGGNGALVFPDRSPSSAVVLVPSLDNVGSRWEHFHVNGGMPAPQFYSPGYADYFLTEATRTAAELISAVAPQGSPQAAALPDPRLTVGHLSDFYDVPGLPMATPPRAAKLFARADRVAAILETVHEHAGDHSFDPQLLPLWRHIRAARMAGVAYAVGEFQRLS